MTIVRELHDETPESNCSFETMTQLRKQSETASENLTTQVLYRRKTP